MPDLGRDAILRDLAAAEARAETLARQVAAVEDVLRDPATSWWHAGGTPCVPAHAIRAVLDTATEEAAHE